MLGHHFDFDGKPIDRDGWFRLWQGERHVAFTQVGDEIEVSTVWMGLDYNFTIGDEPHVPLIYETMIFGGKHHEWCERWPNRHAALAGHDQAVALARESLVTP